MQEREMLIREYLGKSVTVVIDRPIGFHHVTKGIHLHYIVNYGFLPGVTGGDVRSRMSIFWAAGSRWRPSQAGSSGQFDAGMTTRISW